MPGSWTSEGCEKEAGLSSKELEVSRKRKRETEGVQRGRWREAGAKPVSRRERKNWKRGQEQDDGVTSDKGEPDRGGG